MNGKRGQLSQIAEPYHAGLTAAKRKRTQKYFMDGNKNDYKQIILT